MWEARCTLRWLPRRCVTISDVITLHCCVPFIFEGLLRCILCHEKWHCAFVPDLLFFFFLSSNRTIKCDYRTRFAYVPSTLHFTISLCPIPPCRPFWRMRFTCPPRPFENGSTASQSEKVSRDGKVKSDWLACAGERHSCSLSQLTGKTAPVCVRACTRACVCDWG